MREVSSLHHDISHGSFVSMHFAISTMVFFKMHLLCKDYIYVSLAYLLCSLRNCVCPYYSMNRIFCLVNLPMCLCESLYHSTLLANFMDYVKFR